MRKFESVTSLAIETIAKLNFEEAQGVTIQKNLGDELDWDIYQDGKLRVKGDFRRRFIMRGQYEDLRFDLDKYNRIERAAAEKDVKGRFYFQFNDSFCFVPIPCKEKTIGPWGMNAENRRNEQDTIHDCVFIPWESVRELQPTTTDTLRAFDAGMSFTRKDIEIANRILGEYFESRSTECGTEKLEGVRQASGIGDLGKGETGRLPIDDRDPPPSRAYREAQQALNRALVDSPSGDEGTPPN